MTSETNSAGSNSAAGSEATAQPLAGRTVAITATRKRLEFGAALERRGATVSYAPAVHIVPLADDDELRAATRRCLAEPVDLVVATTGIGLRGWLDAASGWGLGEQLLAAIGRAELITRGPKARGAARAAGLTEAWSPESEATAEVLDYLTGRPLAGKRVAVQLHGEPLTAFLQALRDAGADVIEAPVYRSVLPDDLEPLRALLSDIAEHRVDAVAFTSAAASANLLALARDGQLPAVTDAFSSGVLAACVGPMTAAPLEAAGIPTVQPDRHRLGALVTEIVTRLA